MTTIATKAKNQDKSKMCEIDDQILRIFEFKKRLGKGAYGIVWKALDKRTNDTVAVKKIFDAFRDETDAQRTFREITFLNAFRSHPNIVMLHNVFKASNNLDIYLVFEFMDTDLHNIIKRGAVLKDVHKRYIMYQLINAVKYIHSGNVIHRDLKPSNVLVDCKCRCKLADFGLARSVSFRDTGREDVDGVPLLTDYVATRWYRAPEILVASKRYTKGIDMWSLGCILGEMLLGKPLFQGTSTVNQIERIVMTLPKITDQDVKAVGADFGAVLLNKQICSERSLSLEEILGEVPVDAMDLVKQLLVLDPLGRLTALQALQHPFVSKYRNPETECNVKGNIVPPLNDDIRLTVPEYRTKLYEIVAEVPGMNKKKQTNFQKRQRAGNQQTIVAYDKTTQSGLNVHKAQYNQSFLKEKTQTPKDINTKHAVHRKVLVKTISPEVRNVPLKTMIGNLSSKPNVIYPSKKQSPPQEGLTFSKKCKSKMKSTRNHQTPKEVAGSDIMTNTSIGRRAMKICREHFSPAGKLPKHEAPIKARIFTSYPKINKSYKTLTGKHQKEHSSYNSNDRKFVQNILPPESNKEQKHSQPSLKSSENQMEIIKTSHLHNFINDQNTSHHSPISLGRKQKCSSLILPLIVHKNADNIADKLETTKGTSLINRQSGDSMETTMENIDRKEVLPSVNNNKTNEPSNEKCVCYEERLRRIEREIKSYEQEVKSFAYDTMVLTQKRLRSAESLLAVNKHFVSKAQIKSDQSQTRHSFESKSALVGRVSFAGSSFGQIVTNNHNEKYINSAVTDSGNDSRKSDREVSPEKYSMLSLSANARNPLSKRLTTCRRKLLSGDAGSGGSGDHLSSKAYQKRVDIPSKESQHQHNGYGSEHWQKLERSVSSLLKVNLPSTPLKQQQSQINVQAIQWCEKDPQRNLKTNDNCYNSSCKRKPTKAF